VSAPRFLGTSRSRNKMAAAYVSYGNFHLWEKSLFVLAEPLKKWRRKKLASFTVALLFERNCGGYGLDARGEGRSSVSCSVVLFTGKVIALILIGGKMLRRDNFDSISMW